MIDAPPPLEEVRARLRAQGYLDAGIERAIFNAPRAWGAIVPSAAAGAAACAVASAAALSARGAVAPGPGVFAAAGALVLCEAPLAAAAGGAALVLSRLRRAPSRPARSALLAAAAAALLVFGLFTAGVRSLPASPGGHPWLSLAAVAVAAFYFARAVRATSLSLALRRHVALPERFSWRRGSAAALAALLALASVWAVRREPPARFPALTIAPRPIELVVVALDGVSPETLALLAPDAPLVRWRRAPATPPEIWTTIATGVPPSRHGVAAFERISLFGAAALTPPAGTAWLFRGPLRWAGATGRLPVSGAQRRAWTFWEIAARTGVPTVSVNWWASENVPGAAIVENREIALRARNGAEDDAQAIAAFRRLERETRPRLATVYLPGSDIDRGPLSRAAREFVAERAARARSGGEVLWLVADGGRSGTTGGWALVDPAAVAGGAGRAEDVAPTAIARLGIPAARDLAGTPRFALFRKGALEGETVATYGDRRSPGRGAEPTETGREYLEKLKSLGYLQ
ncbi:MAG TPA: hypothetical protein VKH46_06875 [Thermoanaerobaculia bacterium]|nr:hypothetical protein [Thermoanaerobaculia bacterium]